MTKSTKAFMLSALVFPGIGHFYLKKQFRGVIFTGISTVCLYFLLVTTVNLAQDVSDKILKGEIAMDIVEISAAIVKLLEDSAIHQLNLATFVLFGCWFVSMADSYRLGRLEDQKDKAE